MSNEETASAAAGGDDKISTEVAHYNPLLGAIEEMRRRHANVVIDVSTPDGMRAAKEGRRELVRLRTSLEEARVMAKDGVLKLGRKIDSEAKRLQAIFNPWELAYDDAITREEQRVAKEREAAARAERDRVSAIEARVARIRDLWQQAGGLSSKEIEARAELANNEVIDDSYQELQSAAAEALAEAKSRLAAMLNQAREAEQLAAVRRDIERAKERQAEVDRIRGMATDVALVVTARLSVCAGGSSSLIGGAADSSQDDLLRVALAAEDAGVDVTDTMDSIRSVISTMRQMAAAAEVREVTEPLPVSAVAPPVAAAPVDSVKDLAGVVPPVPPDPLEPTHAHQPAPPLVSPIDALRAVTDDPSYAGLSEMTRLIVEMAIDQFNTKE